MDLDAWINEPEPESDEESRQSGAGSLEIFYKSTTPVAGFDVRDGYQGEAAYEEPEDVQQQRKEARRAEQANNPHYLKATSKSQRSPSSQLLSPADDVPVVPINLSVPLQVSGKKLSDKYLELERSKSGGDNSRKHRSKKDKKKKNKKGKKEDGEFYCSLEKKNGKIEHLFPGFL